MPGPTVPGAQLGGDAFAGPAAELDLLAQARSNVGPPPVRGDAGEWAAHERGVEREVERLRMLRRWQAVGARR